MAEIVVVRQRGPTQHPFQFPDSQTLRQRTAQQGYGLSFVLIFDGTKKRVVIISQDFRLVSISPLAQNIIGNMSDRFQNTNQPAFFVIVSFMI